MFTLSNAALLFVQCIHPAFSSPHGVRHGSEHRRNAQMDYITERMVEGSQSTRYKRSAHGNRRKLRGLSNLALADVNSLFNTYVGIQRNYWSFGGGDADGVVVEFGVGWWWSCYAPVKTYISLIYVSGFLHRNLKRSAHNSQQCGIWEF